MPCPPFHQLGSFQPNPGTLLAACEVDHSISEGHPSPEVSGLPALVLSFLVGYAEWKVLLWVSGHS